MLTPSTAQPTMEPAIISVSSSQTGHGGIARAAQHLEDAEADERPDHEDVAVGEVQQLEHAVDERVAEGDQRVRAALGQAVERQLREGVQSAAPSLNARGRPGIMPDRPLIANADVLSPS